MNELKLSPSMNNISSYPSLSLKDSDNLPIEIGRTNQNWLTTLSKYCSKSKNMVNDLVIHTGIS